MQKTLLKPVRLDGFGFWRCEDSTVILTPSAVNTGIAFIRDDLPQASEIPACMGYLVGTAHRTSLGFREDSNTTVEVDMVEHVLAALFSMEISNCRIHVSSLELPALDGSALPYVEAISQAGIIEQIGKSKPQWRVTKPIRVGNDSVYLEVYPPQPDDTFSTIEYKLNYPNCPSIGRQEYTIPVVSEELRKNIIPARTFATQPEAVALQKMGLCRRVTPQNCLVFTQSGVLENHLRFDNECARHKILDFIGDLFLGGIDWIGRFRGVGSGHELNYKMLEKLLQQKNGD